MKNLDIKKLLVEFKDNLKFNYDIKKKNWFNIGGKTKLFFKAENLNELKNFIKKIDDKKKNFCSWCGLKYFVHRWNF